MITTRILRAPARSALRIGVKSFSTRLESRFEPKSWTPVPYITETIVSSVFRRRPCIYTDYSGRRLAHMYVFRYLLNGSILTKHSSRHILQTSTSTLPVPNVQGPPLHSTIGTNRLPEWRSKRNCLSGRRRPTPLA